MDSEPRSRIAWLEVLDQFGHPATEADIKACTGLGFGSTHEFLSTIEPIPPPRDVWSSLLEALPRSFQRGLEVFPDAIELLDAVIAADCRWQRHRRPRDNASISHCGSPV